MPRYFEFKTSTIDQSPPFLPPQLGFDHHDDRNLGSSCVRIAAAGLNFMPVIADTTGMSATLAKTPAVASERRRSNRKAHVVKAYLSSPTATADEPREEAMSINVSRHGVAFLCKHELPVGTYHLLDIFMGETRSQAEVRVKSCRKRDDRSFEIGAQFS